MSEDKINKLEINMAELNSDVKYIKENLEKHIDKEDAHIDKLDKMFEKFFEKADKKYASKRVEIIFWGGLSVIGTTLLIWAIKILLQHSAGV